jgi:predicted alpha/beta-fold hydrolase
MILQRLAQQFADTAAKHGYISVMVGARGLETPLTNGRLWHPGFYEDAVSTLHYLHNNFCQKHQPKTKIYLVGYSAGSNIVHKTVSHFSRMKEERKNLTKTSSSSILVSPTANRYNLRSRKPKDVFSSPSKVCSSMSSDDNSIFSDIPIISGATCICINSDYTAARSRLESTFIGAIYSMLMCAKYKELVQKNEHVHDSMLSDDENEIDSSEDILSSSSKSSKSDKKTLISQLLSKCFFVSHYDEVVGLSLHKYQSPDHLHEAVSMTSFKDIDVPLLAMQPLDDPLHMVRYFRHYIVFVYLIHSFNLGPSTQQPFH